jgi:hypothetical protein
MIATKSPAARAAAGLSLPALFLKIESLAILVAAAAVYFRQGYNGWVFALLLFAPDLAMLGYLAGARAGSVAYNVAHTYALPAVLGLASLLFAQPLALQLALIWLAHIGLDRLLGYGLKYPAQFKDTHLGRV